MGQSVLDIYDGELKAGRIAADASQVAVVMRLDELARALEAQPGAPGWRRLFGARNGERQALRGLYIWGDVGRGKTMLMDLFFAALPDTRKRRIHFYAFMQDAHKRLRAIREKQRSGEVWEDADPVKMLAGELAREIALLCLDEFQVVDITDAMILGRLFQALFSHGIVVVATSNTAPRELYRDGLNRNAFLPFIDLIAEKMDVRNLNGAVDYRIGRLKGREVWLTPVDAGNRRRMEALWRELTDTIRGTPLCLPVKGRSVEVPQAARGAARFGFEELCARPLGPADYLALAAAFHTLFIDAVPVMDETLKNERRRFTILIDTLYDNHIRLVATAFTAITDLAPRGSHDAAFARTVSRLQEMLGDHWWMQGQN
jgi:cell division protein ZapE